MFYIPEESRDSKDSVLSCTFDRFKILTRYFIAVLAFHLIHCIIFIFLKVSQNLFNFFLFSFYVFWYLPCPIYLLNLSRERSISFILLWSQVLSFTFSSFRSYLYFFLQTTVKNQRNTHLFNWELYPNLNIIVSFSEIFIL